MDIFKMDSTTLGMEGEDRKWKMQIKKYEVEEDKETGCEV